MRGAQVQNIEKGNSRECLAAKKGERRIKAGRQNTVGWPANEMETEKG
jgi:hypothetical protein